MLSHGLALAFLDGKWSREGLLERGETALGARPPFLHAVVRRVLSRFDNAPAARFEALVRCIEESRALRAAERRAELRIRRWFTPAPAMQQVSGPPADFALPALESAGALSQWLGLSGNELEWFADLASLNADRTASPRLRHYHYQWLSKRGAGHRLVEASKPRLRRLQRALLDGVLQHIPAAAAAHGFVRGRSIHSFAQMHVGQAVVVRLDLEDFFSSIRAARVRAIFARVGYPETVAALLAGLTTSRVPEALLAGAPRTGSSEQERFETRRRLRARHLPQGAPSSPALANLAAFRLDRRLGGWARRFGASYTRYADDLAFSGGRELDRGLSLLLARAAAIAQEEGFAVRHRKTRVMHRNQRQQLSGLVLNEHLNVRRAEYDQLRALLHNAAHTDAASQNRAGHPRFREHIAGRIAWVASTHPERARKLQALFARVDWSQPP